MIVLQFTAMILLPIVLTAGLRLLEIKNKKFAKSKFRIPLIGIIFGLACVYGTECGVDTGIAIYNTRDASVICAGLFGWQSALIAAFIGATERFLAPLWGVGEYTRLACSIATATAGILAAFLNKTFFKKRPSCFEGFFSAFFIEIFHMLLVFVTHTSGMHKAGIIIRQMTVPIVLMNSSSVAMAIFIMDVIDRKKIKLPDKKSLAVQYNYGLLIAMAIAFTLSVGFTADLQKTITKTDTKALLLSNIQDVKNEIDSRQNVANSTLYRHINNTGYVIIADNDLKIISDVAESNHTGKNLTAIGFSSTIPKSETLLKATIKYVDSYYLYETYKNVNIIAIMPIAEAQFSETMSISVSVFMEFLVIGLLFVMVTMLTRKLVINNIESTNKDLSKITNGDLNTKLSLTSSNEFTSLSKGINTTVNKLKKLIKEANQRIDAELFFAKQIQEGSLPSVFPPYPERKEFDIYATMDAAKEIGGDFYDFFLTSGNKLFFLVADVSGKGIPAALFMMRAKTLIRDLAESGSTVSEIALKANNALCENNEAGLFVTAWIGCLDIDTGNLSYVNAGHNPPVLMKDNETPVYLRNISGLVLAGIEGINYKEHQLKLQLGDRLFLYTDGVTEATDKNLELYSESRLEKVLTKLSASQDVKLICQTVKKDIDGFVKKAEQFDDITTLSIIYKGNRSSK